MKDTSGTGQIGEQAAAEYLRAGGFTILEMNFQNTVGRRKGEIDIIAKEADELVFVEVKTRKSERYLNSLPEENITRSKLHKLERIAAEYLRQHRLEDAVYRFDAVSIWLNSAGEAIKVKHLRNIFL